MSMFAQQKQSQNSNALAAYEEKLLKDHPTKKKKDKNTVQQRKWRNVT